MFFWVSLLRYFFHLLGLHHIVAMPVIVRSWAHIESGDGCMYPPMMHCLTQWELENCPWWIDMEKNHLLVRERELHATQCKGVPVIPSSKEMAPSSQAVERAPATSRNRMYLRDVNVVFSYG